ncbi:SRPBCC family protein [Mycobacterium sp. CVI_P3]|uniref:SRPBCC family protein n=1 Tax=Mycobacterium pinniadriaticum TaxID=2994102 RepID=A0ABT3SNV4_9MYCO|nr:SRPBCC family protein [Mycobacterium pinniadriaticum]MCX2934800.1 SRPBCC family protein [Mycobacterium pinniadriaticum]MCX2941201.1 SRPBCC family protein [Mycobacterium pinniadriaticum]
MTETIIVTSTVDAPAAAVFSVLADPNTHPDIDGTGWLRESLDGQELSSVGQIFRMGMYHDGHPDKNYEMANQVIAFEADRVIAWAPGGLAEDGSMELGGWTWRYDLEPLGADQTRVTLTYDWSNVSAEVRENIPFPPFPLSHLDNSLANLAKLAIVRT